MTRNIIIAGIVLVVIIACGVVEVGVLTKQYHQLQEQCNQAIQMCQDKTLSVQQYNHLRERWVQVREQSELLLPHIDTYEINLRFAEGQAYAVQGDYKQLHAQLQVVVELLQYVPHLMKPSLSHIV